MAKDFTKFGRIKEYEFCPSCGVQAMITYESQGTICCAICGTQVEERGELR
jgi:hypothetical protein